MSATEELYEDKVKPHLLKIKEMLEKNCTGKQISKAIGVTLHEWESCKNAISELTMLSEAILGENSGFYTKVYPNYEKIEDLIIKGYNIHQIALELGLRGSALQKYLKIYPHFHEYWIECKKQRNEVIAGSLFKRATGYTYEEKKESMEEGDYLYNSNGEAIFEKDSDGNYVIDKNGQKKHQRKKGKVRAERVTKELPGDVGAQIFWLTNRAVEGEETWSRKDREEIIDPMEFARQIKENLKMMGQTVPALPNQSKKELILDAISKMKQEEILELGPVIKGIINDLPKSKVD